MNSVKLFLVFSLLGISSLLFAQNYSADSHWESRHLGLTHSYQAVCRAYIQGAAPILNAIGARNKEFSCGGSYGGQGLSFESLQEGPDANGNIVRGEWIQVQIQTWIDGRYCYYTTQAVDEVLFNIAARNVQYNIQCDGQNQGTLFLVFEALAPEYHH